jgi:molybdate transport system ATP-binding protein
MAGRLIASFRRRHSERVSIQADLELESGGGRIMVLFGPSGSGKTTILRCLAGLDRPQQGSIRYDDEIWFDAGRGIDLPPQQRRLGYVAQEYALFPHLTVAGNIRFGMQASSHEEATARVGELLRTVHLEGTENRLPAELSGGERQRVALARVLARQPRLILLDEPLAALDLPLRDPMRRELRDFLRSIDVPSLIVTHDRVDALTIGDRMAVLVDGSVRQVGPVEEVFSRPVDAAVAASVGVETVVPGEVVDTAGDLVSVRVAETIVRVARAEPVSGLVFVCIRAEDVVLDNGAREGVSARNRWTARVAGARDEGSIVRVSLDCGFPLSALLTRPAFDELQLTGGAVVSASVKATAIHLIPRT